MWKAGTVGQAGMWRAGIVGQAGMWKAGTVGQAVRFFPTTPSFLHRVGPPCRTAPRTAS